MIAALAFLRAKLSGTVAIILAVFAGLVWHRRVVASRDNWKQRAQVSEAGRKRQAETGKREAEIEQEWSDYERESAKEINKVPDIIGTPRKRD